MLCAKCQALCNLVDSYQDNDFSHHETVEELCINANLGCLLCKIIDGEIQKRINKSISISSKVTVKTRRDAGIEVSFVDPRNSKKPPIICVVFQSLTLPNRLTSTLRLLETSYDTNTGSEATFQLASTWLEECLETHKLCSASMVGNSLLPHRVIDVGSTGGLAEPYLLETSSTQVGKYLTLSHCWGGGTPIKTTSKNIQRHRTEIRLSELTRTFRDAVYVTRKIGCRYLWIDSLCIIQDDREDWEVEATMMHQYYKNSLLTIAAADGNDSEAGLFRDRDGQRNRPHQLQFANISGSTQQRYVYTNNMSFEIHRSSISDSFKPIPLYSRAWVFQEQALSPRTLSYARDRIFWRCQEMIFDERAPLVQSIEEFIQKDKRSGIITRKSDPRTIDAVVAELQRKWIFPTPYASGGIASVPYHEKGCNSLEDRFFIDWGQIVRSYTERNMTYHSDKLIAIQGIADAVAPKMSQTHFAGIWVGSKRSILMGLLWSSERRDSEPTQRLDIAPSWSWASTDGEVSWPGHWDSQLKSRIDILELKRSGTAARATANFVIEANLRPALKGDSYVFAITKWPEQSTSKAVGESTTAISSLKWPLNMSTTSISLDESLNSNAPIWFAELATGVVLSTNKRNMHCLVLINCGEEPLTFRRIGYFRCQESDWANPELPETRKMKLRLL